MGRKSAVEYRAVSGFPAYRVGNDGSVWSRWKRVGLGRGTKSVLSDKWRRLVPTKLKTGHRFVRLSPGSTVRYVHHLVLEAFIGPRPAGMEACHFPDRDPANNRVCNLRWDTRTANRKDMVAHGTVPVGEGHGGAKVTAETVRSIRADYASRKATQVQLAAQHGLCQASVANIVHCRTWKHV